MSSFFDEVPLAPPNGILGVAQECRLDTNPLKIDLTIGAYRDGNGKPIVLNAVRKAEERLIADPSVNHEYLPQDGLPVFNTLTQQLMFGKGEETGPDSSFLLGSPRLHTLQCLSGTGSVRLALDFVAAFFPGRSCYIPDVTWPNHPVSSKCC